jgi:hypothetical protein
MKTFLVLNQWELPADERYLIFAEDVEQAERELEGFLARHGRAAPRFHPPEFIELITTKPGVLAVFPGGTRD